MWFCISPPLNSHRIPPSTGLNGTAWWGGTTLPVLSQTTRVEGGGAEGEAGRPGGTPELHRHVHGRHHWSLPLLGAVVAVVVVVGRQTVAHRWGVMATKKGSAHALSTFGYFGCACPLLLFCPFDCAFGHLWPSLPVWAFFPKISQLLAAFDCFWSPLGNVAKSN